MGRPLERRYLLRDRIAEGAVGTVWRAEDRLTGDEVAVKVLRSEVARQPDVVAAFRREGRVLAQLDHPGVVRPREFLAADGELALVMDLVPGTDLQRALRADGPLCPADATVVLAQVCEALAAVHEAGIVHGDVKPSNILLPAGDVSAGVRLADFGVARRAHRRVEATRATPEYAAPEVVATAPVPASDVYAAGLVYYEAMTGRSPFRGGGVEQVLARHRDCRVVRLPGIPDRSWRLIEWCLHRDPLRRPPAGALAVELRALRPVLVGVPRPAVAPDAVTCRPRTASASAGAPVAVDAVQRSEEAVVAEHTDDDYVTLGSMFDAVGDHDRAVRQPSDPSGPAAPPHSAAAAGAMAPEPAEDRTEQVPAWSAPPASGVPAWTGPASSRPASAGVSRRGRLLLGLAAGVVLLVGLALGGWYLLAGGPQPNRPVADHDRPAASASPAGRPSGSPSPTTEGSASASPTPGANRSAGASGRDDGGNRQQGGDHRQEDRPGDSAGGTGQQPVPSDPGAGGQNPPPGLGGPMPTMPGGRAR